MLKNCLAVNCLDISSSGYDICNYANGRWDKIETIEIDESEDLYFNIWSDNGCLYKKIEYSLVALFSNCYVNFVPWTSFDEFACWNIFALWLIKTKYKKFAWWQLICHLDFWAAHLLWWHQGIFSDFFMSVCHISCYL